MSSYAEDLIRWHILPPSISSELTRVAVSVIYAELWSTIREISCLDICDKQLFSSQLRETVQKGVFKFSFAMLKMFVCLFEKIE